MRILILFSFLNKDFAYRNFFVVVKFVIKFNFITIDSIFNSFNRQYIKGIYWSVNFGFGVIFVWESGIWSLLIRLEKDGFP